MAHDPNRPTWEQSPANRGAAGTLDQPDRTEHNPGFPNATTGKPTGIALVCAVEMLRSLLEERYGSDFSFRILGEGSVLAASDYRHGVVLATTA